MPATSLLIVEDELIIATDLRRQLLRLGYSVTGIATSTAEARRSLADSPPDLVLLDIYLHGDERGTVLGRELLAAGERPFIYLTSHADRATVSEATATRPSGYLVKPFTREDVYVAIETALVAFAHQGIDGNTPAAASPAAARAPARIRNAVALIRDNLHRRVTLSELAAPTGWNVYHFARTFKKYLGVSPYEYALRERIGRAGALLTGTDRPIGEIADEVGFDSHSHFSRTFRKHLGQSPEAYRAKTSIL